MTKKQTEQMRKIALRIKTRREELQLSFQQLSDSTGISKSTLQRYETGGIKNIPLDKLEVLAKGLKTTPEWILGWDRPIQEIDRFVIDQYPGHVPGKIYINEVEPVSDLLYAAYQELEGESDEVVEDVLKFIKFVKSQKKDE